MQGFTDTGVSVGHFRCFSILYSNKWTFFPQKRFEIEKMVIVVLIDKTGTGNLGNKNVGFMKSGTSRYYTS